MSEIIQAYEAEETRQRKTHQGIDHSKILNLVASAHDVTPAEVREEMLDHWNMLGAG